MEISPARFVGLTARWHVSLSKSPLEIARDAKLAARLDKLSGHFSKGWHQRFVIVKPVACLLYFEQETDSEPKGVMMIDDNSSVEILDQHAGRAIVLAVRQNASGNGRTLYFAAETKNEARYWRDSINRCRVSFIELERDDIRRKVDVVDAEKNILHESLHAIREELHHRDDIISSMKDEMLLVNSSMQKQRSAVDSAVKASSIKLDDFISRLVKLNTLALQMVAPNHKNTPQGINSSNSSILPLALSEAAEEDTTFHEFAEKLLQLDNIFSTCAHSMQNAYSSNNLLRSQAEKVVQIVRHLQSQLDAAASNAKARDEMWVEKDRKWEALLKSLVDRLAREKDRFNQAVLLIQNEKQRSKEWKTKAELLQQELEQARKKLTANEATIEQLTNHIRIEQEKRMDLVEKYDDLARKYKQQQALVDAQSCEKAAWKSYSTPNDCASSRVIAEITVSSPENGASVQSERLELTSESKTLPITSNESILIEPQSIAMQHDSKTEHIGPSESSFKPETSDGANEHAASIPKAMNDDAELSIRHLQTLQMPENQGQSAPGIRISETATEASTSLLVSAEVMENSTGVDDKQPKRPRRVSLIQRIKSGVSSALSPPLLTLTPQSPQDEAFPLSNFGSHLPLQREMSMQSTVRFLDSYIESPSSSQESCPLADDKSNVNDACSPQSSTTFENSDSQESVHFRALFGSRRKSLLEDPHIHEALKSLQSTSTAIPLDPLSPPHTAVNGPMSSPTISVLSISPDIDEIDASQSKPTIPYIQLPQQDSSSIADLPLLQEGIILDTMHSQYCYKPMDGNHRIDTSNASNDTIDDLNESLQSLLDCSNAYSEPFPDHSSGENASPAMMGENRAEAANSNNESKNLLTLSTDSKTHDISDNGVPSEVTAAAADRIVSLLDTGERASSSDECATKALGFPERPLTTNIPFVWEASAIDFATIGNQIEEPLFTASTPASATSDCNEAAPVSDRSGPTIAALACPDDVQSSYNHEHSTAELDVFHVAREKTGTLVGEKENVITSLIPSPAHEFGTSVQKESIETSSLLNDGVLLGGNSKKELPSLAGSRRSLRLGALSGLFGGASTGNSEHEHPGSNDAASSTIPLSIPPDPLALSSPGRLYVFIMGATNLPESVFGKVGSKVIFPRVLGLQGQDRIGRQAEVFEIQNPAKQAMLSRSSSTGKSSILKHTQSFVVAPRILCSSIDSLIPLRIPKEGLNPPHDSLMVQLIAKRTLRADISIGYAKIDLGALNAWPGQPHAVWLPLEPLEKHTKGLPKDDRAIGTDESLTRTEDRTTNIESPGECPLPIVANAELSVSTLSTPLEKQVSLLPSIAVHDSKVQADVTTVPPFPDVSDTKKSTVPNSTPMFVPYQNGWNDVPPGRSVRRDLPPAPPYSSPAVLVQILYCDNPKASPKFFLKNLQPKK